MLATRRAQRLQYKGQRAGGGCDAFSLHGAKHLVHLAEVAGGGAGLQQQVVGGERGSEAGVHHLLEVVTGHHIIAPAVGTGAHHGVIAALCDGLLVHFQRVEEVDGLLGVVLQLRHLDHEAGCDGVRLLDVIAHQVEGLLCAGQLVLLDAPVDERRYHHVVRTNPRLRHLLRQSVRLVQGTLSNESVDESSVDVRVRLDPRHHHLLHLLPRQFHLSVRGQRSEIGSPGKPRALLRALSDDSPNRLHIVHTILRRKDAHCLNRSGQVIHLQRVLHFTKQRINIHVLQRQKCVLRNGFIQHVIELVRE